MTLAYGFVKAKMTSLPRLQSKPVPHDKLEEIQYHLHFALDVGGADWDIAANVGTNNAADLLKYKIVQNFHHPIVETLRTAPAGKTSLTGTCTLPALDFLRSTILDGTGGWLQSDVLDGSPGQEPPTQLDAFLSKAFDNKDDVYVFGRFYTDGNGVHDVHMNQGSRGRYIHRAGDDRNDHNDIWQDGALMLDLGVAGWVAYFAAFMQQTLPADELGNPVPGGHTI
ncbi:MAG: DUF2278 family protein [Rhodomicrobium sp.]